MTRITVSLLDGTQFSVVFDNIDPARITAADVREKVLRDLGLYRPVGADGARLYGLFALQPASARSARYGGGAARGVGRSGVVLRRIPDTASVVAFTQGWNAQHKDGWRHVVFKRARHVPGSVVDRLFFLFDNWFDRRLAHSHWPHHRRTVRHRHGFHRRNEPLCSWVGSHQAVRY